MVIPAFYRSLVRLSTLTVSPDNRIAYTVYGWQDEAYGTRIELIDRGQCLSVGCGGRQEHLPCFSPEGLYFVSDGRLALWSGDARIVFAPEDWEVYGYTAGSCGVYIKLRQEKPVQDISELGYRNDGDHGFTRYFRRRLVHFTSGTVQVLAEGRDDWQDLLALDDCLVYRKKGHWYCLKDGSEQQLVKEGAGNLPACPAAGGLVLPLVDAAGNGTAAFFDPSGNGPVLFRGLPDLLGRSSAYCDLSPEAPSLCAGLGDTCLYAGVQQGEMQLFALRPSLLTSEPYYAGDMSIFEVACSEDNVYVLAGSAVSAPEVCFLKHGRAVPLAHHNAFLENESVPYLPLTAPSQDGRASLHGYLLLPRGSESIRSLPLLVWVHGGPEGYYAKGLDLEKQAAVTRGYAVLLPNPRGSTGYGAAYQDPEAAFSSAAPSDILALMDEAFRAFPSLDRDRTGILGGSYGGYISAYLAGHSSRFAAAVSMKPVANWLTIHFRSSQSGQNVFSSHFDLRDFLLDTFRASPVSAFENITIPMLLIHGLDDQQCPPENSIQLYHLLRAAHPSLPVKLLLLEKVCHRYGRDHLSDYIRIQTATLDWMDRYL